MRIGLGFLLAIFTGALWGMIALVLVGIALTMVTGLPGTPVVFSGIVAGAASGATISFRPAAQRSRGLAIAAFFITMLALLASALMMPFSLPLSEAPFVQGLAIALFGLSVTGGTWVCLRGIEPGANSRYKRETLLVRVFKGVGFIFFTSIVVLPFYVMVMTSLKSQQQLLLNPMDLSINLSQGPEALFRSYVELFTQFNFGRFLLVSTVVSMLTVVITLAFSIPGAYAVSRLRFPGRDLLSRSVLLIYMVPAIVLVIPLYAVFSQLGLRNSLTGLLIIYPATTVPVALYMLQGYFKGLPPELEEAGLMDGLNRIGVIFKITLPLALPALASVSLYVFMIAWNEFLFAFMFLDDPAIFTLSRGVVSLNSSEVPRQHLMAGAVVATIPIMVIFLWFERFLVQGLTAGSVKG